MFICGDLLVIPDVSGDVHQLKWKPAPRPLEARAIYDKIKQMKEKKGHSVFVKGSLLFYTTFILHTPTTHIHTHHFVKLHKPKQVPLFISALTEPQTRIESTVFVQSCSYLIFFCSFGKWLDCHIPYPKPDLFSINGPDFTLCFSKFLMFHFTKRNETLNLPKKISIECIYILMDLWTGFKEGVPLNGLIEWIIWYIPHPLPPRN